MDRRDALRTLATIALTGAAHDAVRGQASDAKSGEMIYRTLGRTGEKVSAIGLGGHHIGRPKDAAGRHPHHPRRDRSRASTSWTTAGTTTTASSERRMGKALRDGYRKKRLPDDEVRRPHESRRPRADRRVAEAPADGRHRPDAVSTRSSAMDDPDRIFAAGGADGGTPRSARRRARFATSASPATRIRRFTCGCWTSPRQNKFHFDAVQMPLNVLDAHFRQLREATSCPCWCRKASACWA